MQNLQNSPSFILYYEACCPTKSAIMIGQGTHCRNCSKWSQNWTTLYFSEVNNFDKPADIYSLNDEVSLLLQ